MPPLDVPVSNPIYRPPYRKVQEMFSPAARPTAAFGTARLRVHAMNEESILVRASSKELDVLPRSPARLVLEVRGASVYDGPAVVRAIASGAHRAEIDLLGDPIDLAELARRDARLSAIEEIGAFRDHLEGDRMRRYAEALQRIVLFVQHHRCVLAQAEERLRRHAGADFARERDELAQAAFERILPEWESLRHAACASAREFLDDPNAFRTARFLTENTLTHLLQEAPIIERSYGKPLGYPGDYRVMLYCYDRSFEGTSLFGRVFHRVFTEFPLSRGVRSRMELVVDLICGQVCALGSRERRWRIMNLGCGPALEIPEVARRLEDRPDRFVWTLIDQEPEALEYAHAVARVARRASGGRHTHRGLCMSFTEMLHAGAHDEPQDVIFSSGLFDYLDTATGARLVRTLYDRLQPGGVLAVGNAHGPGNHFWVMDFLLDWHLKWRDQAAMRALEAALPPEARAEVVLDGEEVFWYLVVRKPGPG